MLNFFKKQLDNQSKTLFKNSSWVFMANFFGAGLAMLRAVIIARALGAEWYGIFTVIVVFIATIQETMNLNLGAALIRFGSLYKTENAPEKLTALLKICITASFIVALLSIGVISGLTYYNYDAFVKLPDLEWFAVLYAIAASSLFFNQISQSTLRLYFKFKLNSKIQMLMDIIEFSIIASVLFLYPHEFSIFLMAILAARFINSLIPNIAAYRELRPLFAEHIKVSYKIISDQFGAIRSFVFKNSLAKTMQSLIKNGDVLLIAFLTSDPIQVAFYTVAKKVAFSILTITDPLVTSIYPQICDLYNERKITEIKKMLLKLTSVALIPATLFLTVAILFNSKIMEVVFGAEYISAGKTFYLLAGASLCHVIFFWIQPLLQALNLLGVRLKIYIFGIVIGLISAYLLIPVYGSTGMAISMIIINVAMPLMFLSVAISKLNSDQNSTFSNPSSVV